MADTKISALPGAVSVGTSDILPIVQGGATMKATVAQVINGLVASGGAAVFTSITHSAAEIDTSYVYVAPTTGQTVTMAAGQGRAVINPAATLAALTITLPPSPVNGQIAGAACSQIVTALTVNAPGGATVVGGMTSFAVGGAFNMLYRATNTTWYPAS